MNHNTSAQCHTENGEVFMTDQSGNGHHLKQRTMKKLSETLTEMGIDFSFPIEIKDANGNETYREYSKGFWSKYKYDANGNRTYFENSDDYWEKWEYGSNGNVTHYETSNGTELGTPKSAQTCEGKVVEVDGIKYELKAL